MGEVYRADDLKLGQKVALKFLPERVEQDNDLRAGLLGEVKIARQIAHPNVCRVYDIAEVDGRYFACMEYVDGEDLSRLLRRIGRLPSDKAIEIARQLCAGLSAAHDQDVLHRDLKPANVMIDGRGQARIADFGLAGLAKNFTGAEIRAGTPAYMAPEQLLGNEVTKRSDLYSLGLLLYELFSGHRAFDAKTPEALVLLRQESKVPPLRTLVSDADPDVERVIAWCLENDPTRRPDSAREVAAALPGGDRLAVAMAAGATPSPEVVADADTVGSLHPALGWLMLVGLLVALPSSVWLGSRSQLTERIPMPKSPAALHARATEIIDRLGLTTPTKDSYEGFDYDEGYIGYLDTLSASPRRWDVLKDAQGGHAVRFWHRESPRVLRPARFDSDAPSLNDPPMVFPGMLTVVLDPSGRLSGLTVVAPDRTDTTATGTEPRWGAIFAEAGLDTAAFHEVPPQWTPKVFADQRAAWEGTDRATNLRLRIEAAAFRGKPVWFRIITPWTRHSGMPLNLNTAGFIGLLAFLATLIVGTVMLARSNVHRGRADLRGTLRLGYAMVSLAALRWIFWHHFGPDLAEVFIVAIAVGSILLPSSFGAVCYLALEPFVRRMWPSRMISWMRALDGRWRDPLVGRDILLGVLAGAITTGLTGLERLTPGWLGAVPPTPDRPDRQLLVLSNISGFLGLVLDNAIIAILTVFTLTLVFLLLLIVVRKPWIAGVLIVGLPTILDIVINRPIPLSIMVDLLSTLVLVGVIYRYGLFAALVMEFSSNLLGDIPATLDPTSWHFGYGVAVMACLLALGIYGFIVALGGRSPFGLGDLGDRLLGAKTST